MANIFWVEDQNHWIDKFLPVLQAGDFDSTSNHITVVKYAEAVKQKINQLKADKTPHIAILDAAMNGNAAAGLKVSKLLHKKWPELPIIFLSEHSGTDIEQQAFEHITTTDFIAKHQHNVDAVLCWRIKAVLRQQAIADKSISEDDAKQLIRSKDLTIDLTTWQVYWKQAKLMNPNNPKRALAPTPRKILRFLVQCSPRPLSLAQVIERLDAEPDRFSAANYRQHIKTLRSAFDIAQGGTGDFLSLCKNGQGIVTAGDEAAYYWSAPNDE